MQPRSVLSLGHSVFVNPDIANAWATRSDECSALIRWLERDLSEILPSRSRSQPVRIVDFGCGDGSTSILLLDKLRMLGYRYEYLGIEPVSSLLNRFHELLQAYGHTGDHIELEKGRIETFEPQYFDFAFVSDVLPYVDNLQAALLRIVNSARSVLIKHPGVRGLVATRQQYQHALGTGASLTKASDDIMVALAGIELGGRRVRHHRFTAHVDVGDILHGTQAGEHLMSYILQQPFMSISPHTKVTLCDWLGNLRVKNNLIAHDVGIIAIS